MELIIDRFEGEFAVVELPDGTMVNMPKSLLPKGAAEGDVIEITINSSKTKRLEKEISELMDSVWED